MKMFSPSLADSLRRFSGVIGYLLLVVVIALSLLMLQRFADRQAAVECHAGNETRLVLAELLEALSDPIEGDAPGAREQRQRISEELQPLVELRDC